MKLTRRKAAKERLTSPDLCHMISYSHWWQRAYWWVRRRIGLGEQIKVGNGAYRVTRVVSQTEVWIELEG